MRLQIIYPCCGRAAERVIAARIPFPVNLKREGDPGPPFMFGEVIAACSVVSDVSEDAVREVDARVSADGGSVLIEQGRGRPELRDALTIGPQTKEFNSFISIEPGLTTED